MRVGGSWSCLLLGRWALPWLHCAVYVFADLPYDWDGGSWSCLLLGRRALLWLHCVVCICARLACDLALFAFVHVWPVTEWKGHGRAFYWVGVRCYGCTVLCADLAYDWDGRSRSCLLLGRSALLRLHCVVCRSGL